MKYSYRTGARTQNKGFLGHLGTGLVLLGIGAVIGFYSGAMVVIAEINAGVTPHSLEVGTSPVEELPSLAVEPMTVQSLDAVSEPSDIQPALGFNMLQNTYHPQLVGAFGVVQDAARVGVYQKTVSPQL